MGDDRVSASMKERQEERRGVHTSRWQPKRVTTHRAAKMQRLPYDLPSGDPRSALHPLRRTQYISRDRRSAMGRRGVRGGPFARFASASSRSRCFSTAWRFSFRDRFAILYRNQLAPSVVKRTLGTHLGYAAQSNEDESERDQSEGPDPP